MFGRFSLTVTMLMLTVSVGIAVWAASDRYQTYQLSEIFKDNLKERFKNEAKSQRDRFYRLLNSYNPAVRMYASNTHAVNYIDSPEWKNRKSTELLLHESVPAWLPPVSIMRSYVWPQYAILLDENGNATELYHYKNPIPPVDFLNITSHMFELSRGQSHVTMYAGYPYVVSSEYINGDNGGPAIVIASPINDELLTRSLDDGSNGSMVALVKDEEPRILVSSNSKLIPHGTELASLEKRYLMTGVNHFDTGSSDLLIKFFSFIPTDEVASQTTAVIKGSRMITALTALVSIASFGLVMFWITSRIQKLTSKVVSFSEDMEIAQPQLDKSDQIDELESRFELLSSAIRRETSMLEHQASHDPLTGLPNRAMFNTQLERELADKTDTDKCFTVFIIDLDRFKDINDTLGHHIGDIVLSIAAERLRNNLKNIDIVARLGGDEFGILLRHTTIAQAQIIADKIIRLFHEPLNIEEHNLEIGMSIGIAEFPTHGDDASVLLQRADIAMYNAKNNRTGYAVYRASEDTHSVSRLQLMGELRDAMTNGSLNVYYQPKTSLLTGDICGAEALLRWDHHDRGSIPPDEFISLAEQTGLIQPVTYWVLDRAAEQCAIWKQNGINLSVSINVSVYCIHDVMLPDKFLDIINRHNIDPGQIVIELTENVFIKDPVLCQKVLKKIDEMGIEISIDDFGTGYSSLSYLKQLPVKEIKIDRSFVTDMLMDDNDATIVQTTIDLGHNLDMRVIAEGVECHEVELRLQSMGCDAAQGYYYGYPMSGKDFLQLLEKASIHSGIRAAF